MKEIIIKIRDSLLKHCGNKQLRTLIRGLISYEMISYIFFGLGTSIVDYVVFSAITAVGCDELISNIISTICAIIFAYITNKLWVFKSRTTSFSAIIREFIKFTNARIVTLVMTEIILLISKMIGGNPYIAKALSMVLTIVLNYIFSKLFIFKKRKGTQNENEETE